jgi:hypothetical protein
VICERCGSGGLLKVIYSGLPGKLCPECRELRGPALFACKVFFNGYFMAYEGPYLPALFYWLRGRNL